MCGRADGQNRPRSLGRSRQHIGQVQTMHRVVDLQNDAGFECGEHYPFEVEIRLLWCSQLTASGVAENVDVRVGSYPSSLEFPARSKATLLGPTADDSLVDR